MSARIVVVGLKPAHADEIADLLEREADAFGTDFSEVLRHLAAELRRPSAQPVAPAAASAYARVHADATRKALRAARLLLDRNPQPSDDAAARMVAEAEEEIATAPPPAKSALEVWREDGAWCVKGPGADAPFLTEHEERALEEVLQGILDLGGEADWQLTDASAASATPASIVALAQALYDHRNAFGLALAAWAELPDEPEAVIAILMGSRQPFPSPTALAENLQRASEDLRRLTTVLGSGSGGGGSS